MICDLCGGTITIHADGCARCSQCNMEYSTEYLRNKAKGGTPQAASQPKASRSQYRMAETAMRQGDNSKALAICDEILSRDYGDLTAWALKIRAFAQASNPYDISMSTAADCFAEACSQTKDQAKRDSFIKEIMPLFMDTPQMSQDTSEIARSLLSIDAKLAETYLLEVFRNTKSSLRNSCSDSVREVRQYQAEAASDYRYYEIVAKKRRRIMSWMSSYLNWAEEIWKHLAYKCNIASALYEIVCIIRDAEKEMCGSTRTDVLRDAESLVNRIQAQAAEEARIAEAARKEAQRRAAEKYWAEHAAEKAQLEQKKAEALQVLKKLNAALSACRNDAQLNELKKKISRLESELNSAGFFAFTQKKKLKAEIAAAEAELGKANARRAEQEAKLQKQIKELTNAVAVIENKLRNPV